VRESFLDEEALKPPKMTEWHQLLASVVIVSASGALAPGPLFVATVVEGVKKGSRAGLLSATGHMIVELPLVLLLASGLTLLLGEGSVYRVWIGLAGGAALVLFGILQIRGALGSGEGSQYSSRHGGMGGALFVGIVFTGLNPYFIAWWLTVGAKLVLDALSLAAWIGILAMYAAHIWIDYAWLYLAALLSHRGASLLEYRTLKLINAGLGALLIALAITMLLDVIPRIFS